MKANARGQVIIEICVMHHVETPERGNRMEHDVLNIDDEIQEDDRNNDHRPIGEVQSVEYSPPFLVRPEGKLHRRDGKHDPQQNGADDHNPEVSEPPASF